VIGSERVGDRRRGHHLQGGRGCQWCVRRELIAQSGTIQVGDRTAVATGQSRLGSGDHVSDPIGTDTVIVGFARRADHAIARGVGVDIGDDLRIDRRRAAVGRPALGACQWAYRETNRRRQHHDGEHPAQPAHPQWEPNSPNLSGPLSHLNPPEPLAWELTFPVSGV